MRNVVKTETPNQNEQHFEGPTSATRKANILVYVVLLFLAMVLALFLFWTFSNTDVLKVNNDPVPVSKISPTPVADGQVVFRIDFCKSVGAQGTVRPSFVNPARELFLPTYEDKLDKGCGIYDVPVIIPRDIPAGKYHVHYRITYHVNPIKTVVEEFNSQDFEVK